MIAEARGIASIPDELTSVDAAPLLCAGITTYNALRNAGLRGGDLVAVQGIGGLGHLGIQFARHMGFRTVAIGRGGEKAKLAKDLGAHVYVDTEVPGCWAKAISSCRFPVRNAASTLRRMPAPWISDSPTTTWLAWRSHYALKPCPDRATTKMSWRGLIADLNEPNYSK
ncbi:MAG TPA: zinc-binding dehydrogenase [Bryobacteraceae bacterium]|nr:zinc-binding dehydrogenase [Bryobacteraceae bacterium]